MIDIPIGDKVISFWFYPLRKRKISSLDQTDDGTVYTEPNRKRRRLSDEHTTFKGDDSEPATSTTSSNTSTTTTSTTSTNSHQSTDHDMDTDSASESSKVVTIRYRKSRRSNVTEDRKKCDIYYFNGHDLLIQNANKLRNGSSEKQYVNVLDMGSRSLLRTKRVYKDMMYRELLEGWSKETTIPMKHLAVYHFAERTNKTMRPHVRIEVDLKERFKGDGNWTDDQINRHLVETKQSLKRIKSIHHRIGTVFAKRRSFTVLDNRKITTLDGPTAGSDAKSILVALKYFDILSQKMYFVNWLRSETMSSTFGDIAKHIESELIPNTMDNGGCLQSLYELNSKMNSNQFLFYEEEATLSNAESDEDSLVEVYRRDIDDVISGDYNDGDIFVFQLNPFHSYFVTLKLALLNEDDKKQNDQRLPQYLQDCKSEFEATGSFWYHEVDEFIRSQVNTVNIEIKIREDSGWEEHWSKALIRQYAEQRGVSKMDRIIDCIETDGVKKYYVKWKRRSYTECTYMTPENIEDKTKIAAFERRKQWPSDTKSKCMDDTSFNKGMNGWYKLENRHDDGQSNGKNNNKTQSNEDVSDEPPVCKGGKRIEDEQLIAINWLIHKFYEGSNGILPFTDSNRKDTMLQSIMFIEHLFRVNNIHGPFLIVIPSASLHHWRRMIESWTDLNCVVYHDSDRGRALIRKHEFFHFRSKRKTPKFHILLTTFEILESDLEWLAHIKWFMCFIQSAGSQQNQQTQAITFEKAFEKVDCERRFLLMDNSCLDSMDNVQLFNVLHFLEPDEFASPQDVDRLHDSTPCGDEESIQRHIRRYSFQPLPQNVKKEKSPLMRRCSTVVVSHSTSIKEDVKRKLIRSEHKWKVETRTTFGMIRKRLGTYYNIKPEHIEIWVPQKSRREQKDHRYDSNGRGEWDTPISELQRIGLKSTQDCSLRFEIVAYNVRELDQITADHNSSTSCKSPFKSASRTKELSLFELTFHTPSHQGMLANPLSMKITYRDRWMAKDFVRNILNLVVENHVFLFTYFGRITEYIRKYEVGPGSHDNSDIDILKRLPSSRFLIVHENENGKPVEYHMKDEYMISGDYQPMEAVKLRIQFLAKNDPLVKQNKLKGHVTKGGHDEMQNHSDCKGGGKENQDPKQMKSYALWVYCHLSGSDDKPVLNRVVIEGGESLKDMILRDMLPHLDSGSILKERSQRKKDSTGPFESFCRSHAFHIMGGLGSKTTLTKEVLERSDIVSSLSPDMWLCISLPPKGK